MNLQQIKDHMRKQQRDKLIKVDDDYVIGVHELLLEEYGWIDPDEISCPMAMMLVHKINERRSKPPLVPVVMVDPKKYNKGR